MKSVQSSIPISSLRNQVIRYFALLMGTTVLLGAGLFFDGSAVETPLGSKPISVNGHPATAPDHPGVGHRTTSSRDRFQQRLIVYMAALLLGMAVLMVVLVRRFASPMDELNDYAGQIANGRLDGAAPVGAPGGIGVLADHLNEVSVNLQELLLYVWNQSGESMGLIDRIANDIDSKTAGDTSRRLCKNLNLVRRNCEALQAIVADYELFDVQLENGNAMAGWDANANANGAPEQAPDLEPV